ncbi:MAG: hypothetical protein PHD43_21080 [Methylococcales bacterium]|nr:hypothetical protein [Methylococcales bacterium]
MKKIALFCIAILCSGATMATSNFSSQNGTLVIPDVNVDGLTVYDSVTLQLNFANGTFSVLNAQPKPSTIFNTPQEPQYTAEGYTIGSLGCATSGVNEITCYLQVVNNQADRKLRVFNHTQSSGDSLIFDDLNNTYKAALVTVGNQTTDGIWVETTLIQGIPVKISIVFKNISPSAHSISAFKPLFYDLTSRREFEATFKDIDF